MAQSKSMGTSMPRRPHLAVLGKGGVGGEVADLRHDVDTALQRLEERASSLSYPELHWLDGTAVPYDGGDLVLRGANLLQGQTFARLTLFSGTSELIFKAAVPGEAGNDLTITIVNGGALAVARVGTAITVTIVVGTSTANAIATYFNSDADVAGIATCDGGGTGVAQVATAATHLAGGVGAGWQCLVSGVSVPPKQVTGADGGVSIEETVCTVTVPDLSAETPARAAGDRVAVVVVTDGVRTLPMTEVLGA
jgi:hypothetical protein